MNVSILIGTFGDEAWRDLAYSRAYPSAVDQGAAEVRLLHLEDGTLAQARNELARAATGTHLLYLDADDELAGGYVAAMAKAWHTYQGPGQMVETESGLRPTRHPPLVAPALLVPAVQYVRDGHCVGTASIPNWGRPLIEINCAVIGTLVPRSLFLKVGGFREEPIYEDWSVWVRCVIAGATLVPVPEAVYCAEQRAGGRNLGATAARTYAAIRAELEPAWREAVGAAA